MHIHLFHQTNLFDEQLHVKLLVVLTVHHEARMMTYDGYSDNHRSERLSDELDDGSPD